MRVIISARDTEGADWLAHVLGEAGISVAVLPEADATSPELRSTELVIADPDAAAALCGDGSPRCILLVGRGATVDLDAVRGRFADVLALPADADDVVARVRHVLAH